MPPADPSPTSATSSRSTDAERGAAAFGTTAAPPARWRILVAFAAIYFFWGSTYLAIRVGVTEVPPLIFGGVRFIIAGSLLFAWLSWKRVRWPSAREWAGISLLGAVIFLGDYALLFWAEQRVPSGIAAVMMATIPMFIALLEIIFLRTVRLTPQLGLGLLVGFGGVALVMSGRLFWGAGGIGGASGAASDWVRYAALLAASLSWSIGTILNRRVPVPASKTMSAATQTLIGGIMLTAAGAMLGEFRGFRIETVSLAAWVAFGYLIVAGSLIGFTAYVWLIHHESPTKVGTYAYVNPVVAVILGTTLGAEMIGWRALVGMICVLASVALITTAGGTGRTAAASGGGGSAGGIEDEQEAQAARP